MGVVNRVVLAAVVAGVGAGAAQAQIPPQGGTFQPYQTPLYQPNNVYNRSVQPLSPYLNLFRGSNPAVNYFYGVRPGLPNGGYGPVSSIQNIPGPRPVQPGLLPVNPPGGSRDVVPSGFDFASTAKETTLSPAGHAVQFANTSGYFPGLAAPRQGGFTKPTPTKKP